MLGLKIEDAKGYCDYVFDELNDIKQKLTKIEEKAGDLSPEDKRVVVENIFSHLHEITSLIDAKVEVVSKSCPALKVTTGERT